MTQHNPQTIYLKDYQPPAFLVATVDLDIDIRDEYTTVTARLALSRNPRAPDSTAPLVLNGDGLELRSIHLDGRPLDSGDYSADEHGLTVTNLPEAFELTTEVRILPDKNTQLEGLYRSRDGLFTQCEPEGFRRITFFPDRPDVMARYTTTIHGDRARFPLLLSNGNLEHAADEPDGRHCARWVDPFPKPSYLFAMVAAKLDLLEDEFVTQSGRTVKLQVYVEPGRLDQCGFAMESLKSSMRWDEETFGLELDLDQYMIVAVSDFNMGAMENKGLNIFNTKYVLARPDTATDFDFMMLDRVVAHEYFHNWTGNRVTCRDWFQLSLKEGLTVFRDQQYGGDRYSHALQRIQEVRSLRAGQFPEDSGPMAHPVRPASYMEINNFYTATVYNKGAEVVRMIHTLLGAEGFRAGMDLYFERHDGEAVCTEDFVAAMQDASGVDLSQMQRWYDQAGTPRVKARGEYDGAARRYVLSLEQSCPPTPGQDHKAPFQIPFAMGLLDSAGNDIPLRLEGESAGASGNRVLALTDASARFVFEDVPEAPVPSLLRGFSAPVILETSLDNEALAHLLAHDSDSFNRWEAGQRLALNVLLDAIAGWRPDREPVFPEIFVDAFGRVLADAGRDPAFAAEALSLPGASYIAEQLEVVDPDAVLGVGVALRRHIAVSLEDSLKATVRELAPSGGYSPDPESAGRRSLRNLCLTYLMELETPAIQSECLEQLKGADNMTDAFAALAALANSNAAERGDALEWFYQRWRSEPLVIDKWFAVQAGSRRPDALAEVRALMAHDDFELTNPNRMRAVVGTFCHANHARFNAADGSGYAFAADQVVALDPINPQVAARLARAFDRWKKFDGGRQAHARAALERLKAVDGLSPDTFEVVSRALG